MTAPSPGTLWHYDLSNGADVVLALQCPGRAPGGVPRTTLGSRCVRAAQCNAEDAGRPGPLSSVSRGQDTWQGSVLTSQVAIKQWLMAFWGHVVEGREALSLGPCPQGPPMAEQVAT